MKKYFVHLLKKNLLPLAALTMFCVVAYVIPVSVASYLDWRAHSNMGLPNLHVTNIEFALVIMAILIPMYVFSYKMNKRSVDMHYSLPISRTKVLVANFLVGLVMMYVAYTVAYLLGFIVVAIRVDRLRYAYFLYLYLASFIPAFIVYATTAFIYTRANTILDGVISVAGAMFLMWTFFAACEEMFYYSVKNYPEWLRNFGSLPFSPMIAVVNTLGDSLFRVNPPTIWFDPDPIRAMQHDIDLGMLLGSIVWLLLAIGATVGLILTEKRFKPENVGAVSDSVFCYKVQIPAYLVLTLFFSFMSTGEQVTLFAIVFAAFVGSVIYKRTVKIGWKYAVVLAVSCVVAFALVLIGAAGRGGLGRLW